MFEELPRRTSGRARGRRSRSTPLVLGTMLRPSRRSWTSCGLLLDRFEEMGRSGDEQERSAYRAGLSRGSSLASGNLAEALASRRRRRSRRTSTSASGRSRSRRHSRPPARRRCGLGDDGEARASSSTSSTSLPPGSTNLFLRAQSARFRAHLASCREPNGGRRSCSGSRRNCSSNWPRRSRSRSSSTEHAERLLADGTAGDAAEPARRGPLGLRAARARRRGWSGSSGSASRSRRQRDLC